MNGTSDLYMNHNHVIFPPETSCSESSFSKDSMENMPSSNANTSTMSSKRENPQNDIENKDEKYEEKLPNVKKHVTGSHAVDHTKPRTNTFSRRKGTKVFSILRCPLTMIQMMRKKSKHSCDACDRDYQVVVTTSANDNRSSFMQRLVTKGGKCKDMGQPLANGSSSYVKNSKCMSSRSSITAPTHVDSSPLEDENKSVHSFYVKSSKCLSSRSSITAVTQEESSPLEDESKSGRSFDVKSSRSSITAVTHEESSSLEDESKNGRSFDANSNKCMSSGFPRDGSSSLESKSKCRSFQYYSSKSTIYETSFSSESSSYLSSSYETSSSESSLESASPCFNEALSEMIRLGGSLKISHASNGSMEVSYASDHDSYVSSHSLEGQTSSEEYDASCDEIAICRVFSNPKIHSPEPFRTQDISANVRSDDKVRCILGDKKNHMSSEQHQQLLRPISTQLTRREPESRPRRKISRSYFP